MTGEVVRGKIGNWDKVGEVDEQNAEGCEGHGSCAIEEDAVVGEGGSPQGSGIFSCGGRDSAAAEKDADEAEKEEDKGCDASAPGPAKVW